jgi:hypothetical protein
MAERRPDVHLAVLAAHCIDSVNASPPFLNGGNDPSDVVECHVFVDRQRHDSRSDVLRDWQIGELYHLRVRHKVRMPVLWWVVLIARSRRLASAAARRSTTWSTRSARGCRGLVVGLELADLRR